MQTTAKKAAPSKAIKAAAPKSAIKAKAQNLANVISVVINKEQRFIYKFQLSADKLSAQKAKQYRQKLRRKLDSFDAAIRLEKNAEIKAKAVGDFIAFYKKEFILNDFSVASLYDGKDAYKLESYGDMLKLVQAAGSKAKAK